VPGEFAVIVLMLVADKIPGPVQLYVTGVVVVVALAFTEVTVQFKTPEAEELMDGAIVFCVTLTIDSVEVQPAADSTCKL
jgi:hypothetical protein